MSRILKKINVNIDAKDKSDEQLGMNLLMQVAENAHLAQNEINEFIGGLADMTGDEFGKLPIKESIEIIKQFKELDGIADFFKLVGQSTK